MAKHNYCFTSGQVDAVKLDANDRRYWRLDRNGIPILDPPGRNGIRSPPKCLPDEHHYVVVRQEDHPADFYNYDQMYTKTWVRCTRCGETDVDIKARREDRW